MPREPINYMVPCPTELAMLAEGRPRYRRTRNGFQYRAFNPTPARYRAVAKVVFVRDGFACQGCGLQPDPVPDAETYDGNYLYPIRLAHVIAYKLGGLFYPDNLKTLCTSCNSKEGVQGGPNPHDQAVVLGR